MPRNLAPYPFVTVMIACHDGDVALLPRAIESLCRQDLAHSEIHVLVAYDGPPSDAAMTILETFPKLATEAGFYGGAIELAAWATKTGYYTAPRNRALQFVEGLYLATMDADNEFAPAHLSGLLEAIRWSHPQDGWPHFVYSRREYVKDEDCDREGVPLGPSPLIEWNKETVSAMVQSPMANFVDTGDMLISVGALYHLSNATGVVWDPNVRRFGDWDLVQRMARAGMRGRAVDQVTNIYHWTGRNLQLTRWASEVDIIPSSIYEKLKEQGYLRSPNGGITAEAWPEEVPEGSPGGAISA